MAMLKKVYDVLSEKLADVKVTLDGEEKPVLDYIEALYDKSEAAAKIQLANKEIADGRERAESEAKEIKKELDVLRKSLKEKEAEIKRHQESSLSEEDKIRLETIKKTGGITPEAEVKINTLAEQLEEARKSIENLNSQYEQSKKAAAEASAREQRERLRTDITTALAKANIVGDSARIALNDILSEGMVGDVEGKRICTIIKNGKKCEVETIDELAGYYASVHEALVSPSGRNGTGTNHNRSTNTATLAPRSRSDMEMAAHQMLAMET